MKNLTGSIDTQSRQALDAAIGSLHLEGIVPSPDDLVVMERVVSGEITSDEAIKIMLERIKGKQA